MASRSPLDDDVFLTGSIFVTVLRRNGEPRCGERVFVQGCGFV
ncbi:MAG: hypothetical protein ACKVX7_13810 [Planctomycetota bacterium]